jgi:hypothetical protein
MLGRSKAWQVAELQTATCSVSQSRSDRANGIELALKELEKARRVVDVASDAEEWARITMDLAELYSIRPSGEG